MVAPLVFIGRGQLQIVALIVAVALGGITCGIAVLLSVVLRGVVTCVVTVVALGAEHQVGLPSLNRLNGDVTGQTGGLSLPLTLLLVQDTDGVVVVVDTEVLIVVTVFCIDRLCGVAHEGLAIDHAACGIHGTILVPALQDIERQLQHVVEHPVRDTGIEVHLLGVGVDEHTLLVAIGEVGIVRGALVTTADAYIMIMSEGCARHGVEPVGVVATVGIVGLAGTDVAAVHHIELLTERGQRYVAAVVGCGTSLALTGLGGDENHTGSTTGTVDSGCRGVFQHVDTLDVLRSNRTETALQTIDEHEWRVTSFERDDTTQTDGRGGARVTRAVGDGQTSHLTFNQVTGVADVTLCKVLSLHAGDGRGDVALALGAVTDDNHFVEQGIVFLKCHIATGRYLLGNKADVRNHQHGISVGDLERVVSVQVGNCSVCGALLGHGGAYDRLALRVLDNTFHCHTLLSHFSNGW